MKKITIILTLYIVFCLFISVVWTSLAEARLDELSVTNVSKLRNISQKLKIEHEKKKLEAVNIAKLKGWPIHVETLDNVMELMALDEYGMPLYYTTNNLNAAKTVSTDDVWTGGSAGLSLTGNDVLLGMWDAGKVRVTHQELIGRITQKDAPTKTINHSTHVAGTMIATGIDSNAKGMSYQGLLDAYDWDSDASEMATAAEEGVMVSNHSYGYVLGWSGGTWYGNPAISNQEDWRFGFYDNEVKSWDELAFNAPYYLIVKAVGNDRGEGPTNGQYPKDGAPNGYDCLDILSTAKNELTVGAVNDISGGYTNPGSVVMTSYSGWGPTDDGRIKPDIVANGDNLRSCIYGTNNTQYGNMSGTSMAAPNVSGSLGLLIQHYRNLHTGNDMLASTLKALVLHTADETGPNPGPDYMYGWGLLNIKSAAQVISNDSLPDGVPVDNIREKPLVNGNTHRFYVNVSPGTPFLRATIVWTDPAGTPPSVSVDPTDKMLVNDLDLRISDGSETKLPWKLNPISPSSAATQDDNDVDNVEQVLWVTPTPGVYVVSVGHKGTLSGGKQDYSIIISGGTLVDPSIATVVPSSGTISGGTSVTITGTNFGSSQGTGSVTFGGIASTDYTWSDTQVVCKTPSHAAGAVDVVLTRDDGKTVTMSSGYTYTSSITLNLVYGWNLISCPGDPVISDIPTLTAGNPNIPAHAALVWNPVTLQKEITTTLEFGKCYFFAATASTQLIIEYYPRSSMSLPLKYGWNGIGSLSSSVPTNTLTSDPSGKIPTSVIRWDTPTQQKVIENTIIPGVGYLIPATADCTLTMNCPSAAPPGNQILPTKPSWEGVVSVHTQKGHEELVFGMNRSASDGFDILYDMPIPPFLDPVGSIDAGWISDDLVFDFLSESFIRDTSMAGWELSVTLTEPGELSWRNLPKTYSFELLYDNQTLDMNKDSSLSLPAGKYSLRILLSEKRALPENTQLLANYPNPFNPETWVPFELSIDTNVEIMIYSSSGQLVRRLDLGHKPAGSYISRSTSAYWDGKNESGETVSSGIYFYSLVTPDFFQTRKLVIVR